MFRNCLNEIVIIISMLNSSQNLFLRGFNDMKKELADNKKFNFCHESGDFLTFLKIYKEWERIGLEEKDYILRN
jgi:hypothetical protein